MRRRNKCLLRLMLVLVYLTSMHTQASELSNRKILGAIPQSFDNIGIVRYTDMDSDTVIGAEFLREVPEAMPPPTSALPVGTYIAERLRQDGLAVAVTALSTQDIAAGMDYSARNIFRLYVAEQSTDGLMRAISSRGNIQQVEHEQYDIYRDDSTDDPTYIAFLDETLILVTNNEDDITVSGSALLAQDAQPASNWSMLGTVDFHAPVLILRYLQYPMTPPPGAEVPHHEDFVLGAWISDMSVPVFHLEASTDLGPGAAEDYIRTVGAIEAVSGPEGVAFSMEGRDAKGDSYLGRLELLHSELGDHYTDLAYIWLLGIWFAI